MKNLFSKLMMVLLIALFALPARAAQNVPSDLYLAYYKNDVWNYSIFEKDASSKVFTCTHNFASGETFYVVKTPNAAAEPSKSSNMYEASDCNLKDGESRSVYLYGSSKNAYVNKSPAGLYTVNVDFSSVDEPYKLSFSSAITEPTYTVSIVGTSSSTDTGTNLSYVGNGIYSGEVNLQGSRYFRVIIDGSKFGPNSDTSDKFVAEGTTETIYMNKDSRAFQAPLLNKKYFVSVDVYNNTVAISTDVYLVGDVADGWDTSKGWKFDTTDGVTYTLTGKNMTAHTNFKLLTSTGTWYGNGKTDITVPYNSTENNSNLTTNGGNMQLSSNADNVNITFNISTGAFSISGGSTPTPSTYSYQLHGTIFDGSWQSKDMTKNDANGAWEWTGTVKKGSFGIRMMEGSDQKAWIWSADKSTISAAGEFSAIQKNGDNGKDWSSTLEGKYTFSFNPETMKLTISGGSTPTPSVSYRLKYTEDNWSNSKYSNPLTDNGNGTYGYTITNPVEGLQFMVQRSTDSGKSYFDFCWPAADNKNYTGGEKTFIMSGGFGNDLTFGAGLSGKYTLTFTPNTTDPKQSTLKISGPSVATFDAVYLRGSDPLSWTENKEAYKFTTTDGKIYTLTGVNLDSGVTMKVRLNDTNYGYNNATVVSSVSQAENDGFGGQNIKLTQALSDATITFDITDATKPVITIGNPKSAYLRGDFTDPNWTDKKEYKFSTTDNQIYVLEHVNIANGKLMKVYYDGNYYGHDKDKVKGPVSAVDDNKGGYNMKLTQELKDATITFDITDAVNWKLTIVNGAKVEHKPYYFAGDMNRWYSKKFDGDETASGIDPEIFAAEKDKWQFEYVGAVAGQTEKGWYKYVFEKDKVGMSTLVGQFQIIDDSGWSGSQYSNNPKVENYSDASGFARYNCRPITRKMINERTVLTKETSEGMPGIIQQAGSNFHLDCNGVNDAVIYFLPGENPKMFITGHPTDYFIFYSASGKTGGDNAVSIKIVNGKPNTTNYYLPGVEGLKNYTTEDAQTIAPHMNIEAVTPTLIDFSNANFVSDDNYNKVFGNSGYVGDLTKEEFQNKIINDSQLPNGISLTGRGKVYVAKVPNGFEYAAGRKFAVTFEKAFSQSEKETSSSIVANHLYFFNDNLHVLLNVDNYEAEAADPENNADVKLYYRVYGYDSEYNTIVVKSDGTTETLYAKNVVIGLTEAGNETQKNAGWVEYNNYKVPSLTSYTGSDKWHYVTDANNDFLGIDPKYGNFFVQFKIVTGPKKSQATNGPAKVVDKEYTLYLPEKTLALNQEGFYNFNGQDLYQKFDGGYTTTDVEDVFEDQIVEEGVDAEPIFFNLQGQRVVNPEKGMYIVVKGNKTYKVMIK